MAVPAEAADNFAPDDASLRIILGKIFGEAGDCGVHIRTAEFFFRRDLSRRGFQQRRTRQKRAAAPFTATT